MPRRIRCDTVEGHRRRADEPDSRWYGGSPYERAPGEEPPADDPFRVPEQRYPDFGGAEPHPGEDRFDEPTSFRVGGGGWSRSAEEAGAGRLRPAGDTGQGGFGAADDPGAEQVRAAHDAMRFPLRPDGTARPAEAARAGSHAADPVVPAPLVPPMPPGALPTGPPTGARPAAAATVTGLPAGPTSGPAPGPTSGAGSAPGPVSGGGATYGAGFTTGPVSGGATTYGGGGSPSVAYPASPAAERTSVVPTVGADPGAARRPGEDPVYATRRPVLGLLLVVLVGLLAIPAVRLFIAAAFADDPAAAAIVPASLLLLGLPLTGLGLWSLANGGRIGDQGAWLRPPVGYLTVGLALLVAAALAVA